MNKRARFPELDLLRFMAACAVMFFHYIFRATTKDHIWFPGFTTLSEVSKYGYLGVDLFFILSGFVILLTAWEKDAISFTFARIVRLYPAYWICLALTAGVVLITGSLHNHITLGQFLANITMAHGYFGIRDVSGVYWTLAVELKFYLLIFLVLLFRQMQRIEPFLGLWLLATVGLSIGEAHGVLKFFLFPEWSAYFIAGAMFFLIHRDGPSAYKLCIILACFGVSAGYASNLLPTGNTIDPATAADSVHPAVVVWTVFCFYIVFLWIALGRDRARTAPNSRFISSLGLITYPLYLIHQDVGYILLGAAPRAWNPYFLLCAVAGFAIFISWLIQAGPEKWLAAHLKKLLTVIRGAMVIAFRQMRHSAQGLRARLLPRPVTKAVLPTGRTRTHGQSQNPSARSVELSNSKNDGTEVSSHSEEGRGR